MVSVIIPNYNHAEYLEQRIESVLNQTYRDFQVILLDDCSTDESLEVLNRYKDHPKVAHFEVNGRNSGSTFKQWKKGLEHAGGEWIWIAESDDFCDNNFLEVLLNSDDKNVGIRFANSRPVDRLGKEITTLKYPMLKNDTCNGIQFLTDNLLRGNSFLNASSVLVQHNLLKKVLTEEIYRYRLLGDWLVWIKVCLLTNVLSSVGTTNYHRCHPGTVRSNAVKEGFERIEMRRFRTEIGDLIRASDIGEAESLIALNRNFYGHYEGITGCRLIQNGQVLESVPHILRATMKLNLDLYYLKSAFYWLFKKRRYD